MGWFFLAILICVFLIDHDKQATKVKGLEAKIRELELELAAKEAVISHATE